MASDNIFVPKSGAIAALDAWLAAVKAPLLAHLYDNNVVYNPDRVLADYNEASFVGYSAQGPISWPPAFTNGTGKAESDSPTLTWNFTGGSGTHTVYGIYVTDDPAAELLLVIPFLTPFTFSPSANSLSKAIQLTDVSELI